MTPDHVGDRLPRLAARLRAVLDPLVPVDAPALLVGSGITNVGDASIALATRRRLAARGVRVLEMDRRTYDARAAARFLGAERAGAAAEGAAGPRDSTPRWAQQGRTERMRRTAP